LTDDPEALMVTEAEHVVGHSAECLASSRAMGIVAG
jgi:hypothetical protein